jgi:hypothetical protein
MKISSNKFLIALLLLIIYEILMIFINPFGLSITKVAITLLVWFSFWFSIQTFYVNFSSLRKIIPKFPFSLYIALICWNSINIFRSLLNESGSLTTMFGNSYTSLALLVPFALTFSINISNIKKINRLILRVITIGISVYFVFYMFSNESHDIQKNRALLSLIYPTVFLITIMPFQKGRNKFLIILSSVFILYISYLLSIRTGIVRIVLLFMGFITIYLYRLFYLKWVLYISFLLLLLPFILLQISINKKQSVIEKYLSKMHNTELSMDTRTFLYIEVLNDLASNDKLIIGKGSNGTYFSTYFRDTGDDTENRLTVEVGILAILLKGGFIAFFLNLAILISAIYLAFFRTNNIYIMGIGFMLLIHILLLFVENFVNFSTYNFMIWYFIGLCLSNKIRTLNNKQISKLLQYGKLS